MKVRRQSEFFPYVPVFEYIRKDNLYFVLEGRHACQQTRKEVSGASLKSGVEGGQDRCCGVRGAKQSGAYIGPMNQDNLEALMHYFAASGISHEALTGLDMPAGFPSVWIWNLATMLAEALVSNSKKKSPEKTFEDVLNAHDPGLSLVAKTAYMVFFNQNNSVILEAFKRLVSAWLDYLMVANLHYYDWRSWLSEVLDCQKTARLQSDTASFLGNNLVMNQGLLFESVESESLEGLLYALQEKLDEQQSYTSFSEIIWPDDPVLTEVLGFTFSSLFTEGTALQNDLLLNVEVMIDMLMSGLPGIGRQWRKDFLTLAPLKLNALVLGNTPDVITGVPKMVHAMTLSCLSLVPEIYQGIGCPQRRASRVAGKTIEDLFESEKYE